MRRAAASLGGLAIVLIGVGCGGSGSQETTADRAAAPKTISEHTTTQNPPARKPAPHPPPARKPNPAVHAYWGAWIGDQLTGTEAPFDMNAVSKFEALAGKRASIVHFAAPFADCSQRPCSFYPFPASEMEAIRRHGAIPFFSWSSQSIPGQRSEPDYQLADVISGRYDGVIRSFANAAREWGHPFFLRFNWEMNGNWFPWAEAANGNRPGQFVEAWRHVHDIFTRASARNVTWVWCPYVGTEGTASMASFYPGDAYVDWSCLDGYNWGNRDAGVVTGWRTFDQIFRSSYREVTKTIAPGKPMAIGEFSTSEDGGDKGAWLAHALASLPVDYPRVRAVVYFEKYDNGMDWPIETSHAARAGFAKGISGSHYLPNDFGSLDTSPIPPP